MTGARQLSLVFEPGLSARYRSLRDVVAHGVYERYLEKTGDVRPIYYLIERFLQDPSVVQAEAVARLNEMLAQLGPLMSAAGVLPARRR